MLAEWSKPKSDNKESVTVTVWVHGYSQASFGDGIRPVAIVSDMDTGEMKFVELKFLKALKVSTP